jgi:serine/threonine-protein kinase
VSAKITPADPVTPPKILGRYEIERELGRGMMGVVYKARDPVLCREVALKIVHLSFAIEDDERKLFEERFLREARLAASLSHPNIVIVHDVGESPEANGPFIALEYLEGRLLSDALKDGPLEWRTALKLAARLADALDHAHKHGIVHRDIKPSNIMLLESGAPKIMDFGIAKAPASTLTMGGEFWGTPSYVSPEQASGGAVDGRSDIFSLGAVLYQLVSARRAFDGDSVPAILRHVCSEDPPPPSTFNRELPAEVDTLVMRAIAKDPAKRPQRGRHLVEDIRDVLKGRPLRPCPRTASRRRRSSGPFGVLASRSHPTRTAPTLDGRPWTGPGHWAVLVLLVVGGAVLAASRGPAGAPWAAAPALPAPGTATISPLPGVAAAATARVAPAPARLALSVQHGVRKGRLKVWVDDTLVLERTLIGRESRRALLFKTRRGSLAEVLDLTPGSHVLRFDVIEDDGQTRSGRLRGEFKSRQTRLLEVKVGDEVGLSWKS